MKITQSFMKSMRAYLAYDLCGNILKHCYVDGKEIDPTDSMNLGSYFEFISFGNLPKNKTVPKPEMMKSGNQMMSPYRVCHANSKFTLAYLDKMGLKIIKRGTRLTKGRYEGTIDLMLEATRTIKLDGVTIKKGEKIVIDVKYSGLMEDRYSQHGWMFSDIQKEYHGTQAKQYHFISGGLKFFFLVVQSNNKEGTDPMVKFFYIDLNEKAIENHLAEGNELMEQFEFHSKVGFSPLPKFNVCNQCQLRLTCKDRALYPEAEYVDLKS